MSLFRSVVEASCHTDMDFSACIFDVAILSKSWLKRSIPELPPT